MTPALITYLQDHLAGAQFAVSLLHDLRAQDVDAETATVAAKLIPEIEEDRAVLERLLVASGSGDNPLKQALAWFTQKAGRLKLTLVESVGIFEAIEMLSLGVLGKLALWNTLRVISHSESSVTTLDLESLSERAIKQHAALEELRRQLAIRAFGG